jgi:hypothetical protein
VTPNGPPSPIQAAVSHGVMFGPLGALGGAAAKTRGRPLAWVAKMVLDAGIDEHRGRLAAEHGKVIVQVLRAHPRTVRSIQCAAPSCLGRASVN